MSFFATEHWFPIAFGGCNSDLWNSLEFLFLVNKVNVSMFHLIFFVGWKGNVYRLYIVIFAYMQTQYSVETLHCSHLPLSKVDLEYLRYLFSWVDWRIMAVSHQIHAGPSCKGLKGQMFARKKIHRCWFYLVGIGPFGELYGLPHTAENLPASHLKFKKGSEEVRISKLRWMKKMLQGANIAQ